MYELKCFNQYSSVTTRFNKDQYKQMIDYAKALCKNFDYKFEYTFINGEQ